MERVVQQYRSPPGICRAFRVDPCVARTCLAILPFYCSGVAGIRSRPDSRPYNESGIENFLCSPGPPTGTLPRACPHALPATAIVSLSRVLRKALQEIRTVLACASDAHGPLIVQGKPTNLLREAVGLIPSCAHPRHLEL